MAALQLLTSVNQSEILCIFLVTKKQIQEVFAHVEKVN